MAFLQSRPRLAAGLHSALIAFAWVMISAWLASLFSLSFVDTVNGKAETSPSILYAYGDAEPEKRNNLLIGGAKTIVNVIEMFIPPLLAALAVALSEMLPIPASNPAFVKVKAKIGRVLGWQLPGRRFFLWWCGGMSVGEAVFLLAFLAAFADRLEYSLRPELKEFDAALKVVDLSQLDRNRVLLEIWGKRIGLSLYPVFVCLFWPVAHDSWLNHVLGIPWQNMIKYHRWMGHIAVWIITVHGALYVAFYAMEARAEPDVLWAHEMFSWKDSHPHLAGFLAWVGAVSLQICSINYIRRRWFEVFYTVHICGFLLLVFMANAHYNRVWLWCFPGLMPWAADLVFRFAQGASVTTVTSAHLSDDHSVATLELTLEEGTEVQPLHDYLINIPCISRWEWHPFTCAGKRESRSGGNRVTFNIKKYGSFTEELFALLEQGRQLPVRVQGPIGLRHAEYPWLRYATLVCVVGGIGISPVLSMLRGLVETRRVESKQGTEDEPCDAEPLVGPRRVIMVWAARHKAEFTMLDESVLAAASEPGSWLDVALHYTGSHMERASSVKHLSQAATQRTASLGSDTSASSSTSSGGKGGGCPLHFDALRFPWTSPLGFSLARPVQPKVGSPWLKIAAILLAHVGGFACVCLASVYYAEGTAIGHTNKKNKTFFSYGVGLLTIVAAFVGALGLPVFASHTWAAFRYFRSAAGSRRVPPSGDSCTSSLEGESPGEAVAALHKFPSLIRHEDVRPATRYASSLIGGRVGLPEAGLMLDITPHRPDIRATLAEAAATAADEAAGGSGDVGVYAAGPQGMVHATKKLVTELNGSRAKGTPYLHFHQETWEL